MTRKLIRTLATKYPFATIEHTRNGHVRLKLPTGRSLFTSSTPSDRRTWLNVRAEIRRQMRLASAASMTSPNKGGTA
jgi:hypothetical protein